MTAERIDLRERVSRPHGRHVQAAAWLLALAFVCVPALCRVYDRVSHDDLASGFRPSKNVERPHEKFTPTIDVVVAITALDRGLRPSTSVPLVRLALPLLQGFSKLVPARAPPLA